MPKDINIYLKTLAIIVSLLMAIGGAIWFCAKKSNEIDRNTEAVVKNGTDITANDRQIDKVEHDVIRFQKDLNHISENLGLLMSEQRTVAEEIMKKLEELKNE
jgi:peptidoglycan hydrolase CwlO-like protein